MANQEVGLGELEALSMGPKTPSSRLAEDGGDAVDGDQERHQVFLAGLALGRGLAVAPDKGDLLAADLFQDRQTAFDTLAEAREWAPYYLHRHKRNQN